MLGVPLPPSHAASRPSPRARASPVACCFPARRCDGAAVVEQEAVENVWLLQESCGVLQGPAQQQNTPPTNEHTVKIRRLRCRCTPCLATTETAEAAAGQNTVGEAEGAIAKVVEAIEAVTSRIQIQNHIKFNKYRKM